MYEDRFRCDVCGKFISFADLESGAAKRMMTTPDSAYSFEDYETMCPRCIKKSEASNVR